MTGRVLGVPKDAPRKDVEHSLTGSTRPGDDTEPDASPVDSAPSRPTGSPALSARSAPMEDEEERALREKAQKLVHHPIFPPAKKLLALKLPPATVLKRMKGGANRTRFDQEFTQAPKEGLLHRKSQVLEKPAARALLGFRDGLRTGETGVDSTDIRGRLIAEILVRWWYVFPEWPSAEEDFSEVLKERGFREVAIAEWTSAKDEEDGLSKVWGRRQFPGVFHDIKGRVIDMRNVWRCPSFVNLQRHSTQDLFRFVNCALTNQCQVLRESCEKGLTTKADLHFLNEDIIAKISKFKALEAKTHPPDLTEAQKKIIYDWL